MIDAIIRERRTTKALAESPLLVRDMVEEIDAVVAAAGWAPFHRPAATRHRSTLASPQPWRCYKLDAAGCRRLRERLLAAGDATKIPAMLAAASGLVLATWLPDPPQAPLPEGALFAPTLENMEHLAAASAAIQNVLLAATARGMLSYWSSGGSLRAADSFAALGIPLEELLLGAVFFFTGDLSGVPTKEGALRDKRGALEDWSRWLDV
ncbi:MAG: nitroreductase family protein [Opitutales bacterium]